MAVSYRHTATGRYLISREFDTLAAAAKGAEALESVCEAAFRPEIDAHTQAHNDGHAADGGGIIPETVAKVMLRDLERDDYEGAPVDPYAGAGCNIGGRCDD